MADTPAKPGLTDRPLEDAAFLLQDHAEQAVGAGQFARKDIRDKSGNLTRSSIEYEKGGFRTTYAIDSSGTLTVTRKYADPGKNDFSVTTIRPNGTSSEQYINNGDTEFFADDRKALQHKNALSSGSKTDAKFVQESVLGVKGGQNPSRTAANMGEAIEARADVRLAQIQSGKVIASQTLQETTDRLTADRIADKLDQVAKGEMSLKETQDVMNALGDKASPEAFKTGASAYADRLRGAEGTKLVSEMRSTVWQKEGADLLGGLLTRDANLGKEAAALGKETKVAAGVLEHPGLAGPFLKATGKVVGKVAAPLGLAIAAHEASAKDAIAQDAVEHGQMSPEALTQYRALQGAQMATVVDPTIVGGEMAVQATYKEFAKSNNLSSELAEALRPSALSDALPEVKQLSRADLSDKQNRFDDIYDGISKVKPEDVSPEDRPALEALQENKSLITGTEQKLDGKVGQSGTDGFDRGKELANLDRYQQQYQQVYDDLDRSGQLDGIAAHIVGKEQTPSSAPAAPVATPENAPSMAASNDEIYDTAQQTRLSAPRPAAPSPA